MTDHICSRCGSAVVAGAHFCSKCGHDVSGEQGVLATAKMAPPETPRPASEILEPLRAATTGEYDIAGELGRGGMATVFLAHDIALARKVAIKVMTPSLVTGQGMVERFKREARTAASLSHPHIIPIYAVRETGQLLFFVMKYVEGRSLDTVIREQGPLPIPLVQAIMAQVGGALGYAHRRGIVHRDMKPANIMLDDEGWAVVTDFGIAKVADARGLTMTGVTIGTPSYMSPEQCASKEITGATDQYSLGIVAFELLTGKVPFDADSLMGIMWKHFNEPPPPVRDLRPDCPPHVADAITRMLAKDPAARWPTMEDAIGAIGQPPMAPGDPIRKQMRALAKGGLGAELQDHVHTPASPIPSSDMPTMRSSQAPAAPTPPPTPPPTPAPTGGTTGRPPSVADVPTVLTGDAPTQLTGDRPSMDADDGATVVTPQPTGPRPAPTPPPVAAATPPAPAVPAAPVRVSAEGTPAPRRRNLLLAIGLPAVAIASAGVVWLALSLRTPGVPEPEPLATSPDTAGAPPAPPPAPVAGVELTPDGISITEGESGELKAFLFDSTNVPLGDRHITWRSSNEAVATVQAGLGVAGIIRAIRAGTARIIATSEGKADTATITVTAGRATVAKVVVQVQADTLAPGERVPIVAQPQDAAGATLGGRSTEWQVSPAGVVRVAGGQLVAEKDGTAQVIAVSEGVRSDPRRIVVSTPAIVSVKILEAPETLPQNQTAVLGVEVRDARGRVVTDPSITWTSSDAARAVVSRAGIVSARSEGPVTITARVGGVPGSAQIRVLPPPRATVARLDVTRRTSTLEVGNTFQVSASPLDAGGRPLLDRAVQWRSSDERVASVGPDGTIAAKAPGRVTITATVEGVEQSFPLEITAPPAPPVGVEQGKPLPPTPAEPAITVSSIGLGAEISCATWADGSASCWGTGAPARANVTNLQRIVTGAAHACGLAGDGTVFCWGNNRYGQLGTGQAANETLTTPQRVATDVKFRRIVAGGAHTCGIATDGKAYCWGLNGNGQLGNRSSRNQAAPVPVATNATFTALTAGDKHTCGVDPDGAAYCWGDGFSYQLGLGAQVGRDVPDRVAVREPLQTIAAGRESTCAVGREGTTYCWGKGGNPFGTSPRAVDTDERFSQLAVGDEFACGLTAGGSAWCWGRDNRGQLGDGAGRNQSAPVKVATSSTFMAIAAGNAHACGVTRDGTTLCWGDNAKGQVGAGSEDAVRSPVPIEIRR